MNIYNMPRYGCNHYKRRVKFYTPCCKKDYPCRICHDEKEQHTLDRKKVTVLVCSRCDKRQALRVDCISCGIPFGNYSCLECRLFDDEDKGQFHCNGCGICRVGGEDKFFHCHTCNLCLPISVQRSHKCVENASKCNCPVCQEELHSSRDLVDVPACGHLLHRACKKQLLENGLYTCPTCQRSIINMTAVWKRYDLEIQKTSMPNNFKEDANILCRDCRKYCTVPYHMIGLKCKSCGSYNTTCVKSIPPQPTARRVTRPTTFWEDD